MDALPPGDIRRIDLIWLGRLGDVLISTPFMAAVRKRFPEARIALITGEKGASAAQLVEDIDEVKVLRRFYRPFANLWLASGLVSRKCDLTIDLNSAYSRSAHTLARITRARAKIAFKKDKGNSTYSFLVETPNEREHMIDRYRRLAEALGADYDPALRIAIPEADHKSAAKLIAGLAVPAGRRIIALFPGNFKKFENRWPEEKFGELTNRMLERDDIFPFFLAGPGEGKEVRGIVSRLKAPVPLLEDLPIGVTAALLSRTGLLVGNCTGTTHLAIAAGCPTYTLLSRYTQTVWMPRPSGAAPHLCAVSDSWESCRDITVADAWSGLERALTTMGPSA